MRRLARTFLWGTFLLYTFVLIKLLFLRVRFADTNLLHHINLIPFRTLFGYIEKIANNRINPDIAIENLIGNLILFFPMGCYLPCLSAKVRKLGKFLLILLGILVGAEVLQWLLCVGSFDVDDLIFNLFGAMMGYWTVRIPFVNRLLTRTYLYETEKNPS